MRGLKHARAALRYLEMYVAPHVGAWIETSPGRQIAGLKSVAPHVGAWIETVILLSI